MKDNKDETKLPPHLQVVVDKINKRNEEIVKRFGFVIEEMTSDQIFDELTRSN